MEPARLKELKKNLKNLLLIKKKENLLYKIVSRDTKEQPRVKIEGLILKINESI